LNNISENDQNQKRKTFFHRSGDVLSAFFILLGTTFLALNVEGLAIINVILILIWVGIGVLIFKEHKRLPAL
jgi:hypothetical protein